MNKDDIKSITDLKTLPPLPPVPAAAVDDDRALLSELRYNSFQIVFISTVFAVFFDQQTGAELVWEWWAAFISVAALRIGLLGWLKRRSTLKETTRRKVIYACVGMTALAWGVAPLVCPPAGDKLLFLVATSWVIIIVLGGANAFQDDPIATAMLALPATLPALVVLLVEDSSVAFAAIMALVVTYVHLIVGNLRARRTRAMELRLKNENAELMREYREQVRLASAEIDRRLRIERELRAARNRAERLSSLDGLTEIANRRHFDEQLKAELQRAFRAHKALSVILLDIDSFKAYNDTYGHAKGDDCLKELAGILSTYARRSGDLAARIGGEEFALLLTETDRDAAAQIAETIRAEMVERDVQHRASDVAPCVTASFGVASTPQVGSISARDFIEAADQALYEAKRAGRNRVVTAD